MMTDVAAPPLSAQLRDAAQTLAAQIEGGLFAELNEAQRCDLRGLPMSMAGWADRVETMEQERSPRRRTNWRRSIVRSLLRLKRA